MDVNALAGDGDTIVAVATPPGRGGVGVVRISGRSLDDFLTGLCDRPVAPRKAVYCRFVDRGGEAIDAGIALYFRAPASFTGQDVIELQGHGGPVVLDMLVARVLELGARLARPGEFTERAFLNGKLDLVQAEAVADLISAQSQAAARGALRSLQGEFSRRVQMLADRLLRLRVVVEGGLDFPDEELGETDAAALQSAVQALLVDLGRLHESVRQGVVLRDGIRLVIAGPPNAGKSCLLNALSGRDAAIVSPVPGTTRDVIRETLEFDGVPVHIVDTAGLRASDDPIEAEGIRRARVEIESADCVLLVVDSQQDTGDDACRLLAEDFLASADGGRLIVVLNKADLSGMAPGPRAGRFPTQVVSALSGEGLAQLRAQVVASAKGSDAPAEFLGRRRHLTALEAAADCLSRVRLHGCGGGQELIAEDLRLAQRELGVLSGTVTNEDLLGEIFGTFCIGK